MHAIVFNISHVASILWYYRFDCFTSSQPDRAQSLNFRYYRSIVWSLTLLLGQASHNYSIQPHGVFFNKSNEGAWYHDHTSEAQKADDIVRSGQTYTYRWSVPEEVGPTETDAQCITWLYYSSVNPVKDTYSGESIFSYPKGWIKLRMRVDESSHLCCCLSDSSKFSSNWNLL